MTLGSGSGDFVVGETVTQTVNTGKTVSGIIVSYSSQGGIYLKHLKLIILLLMILQHWFTNTMFVLSSNASEI